ncbi:hypothetical protein [Acinetobacter baumannii]|uniref:DNA-binding protein n=1 Tax=Acinetobacter baumannii TaxID=470 RepID=A0A505MNX8_ACIBA|nr:hypothetical protein [Acinetobacter baumannii]EJB8497147.1 hypothetical protein [Acinetobacter baumannii]ELB0344552.1 hypothetical protein [Acinetobacter baumannii]KCY24470.1 hypothetical protein J635_0050 [Acinetobacter baumannii 233846]MCJ8816224.1 hypothetical protein [Acinetobacter baumannii]MCJ8987328.1 hypothetical protein [Acinetobacter baumannii]
MEKLTVLQLSKRTGLSRTQIYYLQTKNKLKIINGKIDFNEAMPAIIELLDKKLNKDSEVNFKQILNLLISQNISLQTQLNLAHEREKAYLTELASYRQNLAQETAPQPPIDESGIQAELENDGVDTDENALNKMEAESETQAPTESCQSINKEMKSGNEAKSHPISTESISNEMALFESESGDAGLTRQEKERTEQNDDALIGTSSPNQEDIKPPLQLNRHKRSSVIVLKGVPAKCINLVANTNRRKSRTGQPMTDQEDLNKEDHHDPE